MVNTLNDTPLELPKPNQRPRLQKRTIRFLTVESLAASDSLDIPTTSFPLAGPG